jgi:hypothetical protein
VCVCVCVCVTGSIKGAPRYLLVFPQLILDLLHIFFQCGLNLCSSLISSFQPNLRIVLITLARDAAIIFCVPRRVSLVIVECCVVV